MVAIAGIHAFGLKLPDVEVLFLIHIFANPAFIYFFSFLFDKDDSGSLSIKMLYFIFGIIAPIAISVLYVIPSTADLGKTLRYVFYPLPCFSLTYGFISIANIEIVAQATGGMV